MPRLPKGEPKMTYRTQVFLPDEWAEKLKQRSEATGAPAGVLARMAVIEWLRAQDASDTPLKLQPEPKGQDNDEGC